MIRKYRIRKELMKRTFQGQQTKKLLTFIIACLFQANLAGADEAKNCSAIEKEINQESTLATASFFANERNKPGSIRYESGSMLEKAEMNLPKAEKPSDLCPAGCQISEKPEIIFKAIPNKFLTDYSQYDKCQKLLEETEKTPFNYNEQFASIGEVESWFSDFSRGNGSDGKDLYNKCSGDCSPQYELIISNSGAKVDLDAEVVCGHERDKKDNQYEISYGYRWTCEKN